MPPKPPPPNRGAGSPTRSGAPPNRAAPKLPPSAPPQRQTSGKPASVSDANPPPPPAPTPPSAPTPRSQEAGSEAGQRPPPPRSRPPSVPATPAAAASENDGNPPQRPSSDPPTPVQAAASAPVTPASVHRGPPPTWKPVGRKASVAQPPRSRPGSVAGTPSRSTTPIARSAGPSDASNVNANATGPRSMPPATHTESHSHDESQYESQPSQPHDESQYGPSAPSNPPQLVPSDGGEASVTRGSPSFIRRKTGAPPPRPRSFSRGSRRHAPPSPPPSGSGPAEPLIAGGGSNHHLISLDDKPSVVPRTRSARYVTPYVSRNIGGELSDTTAFGEMLELQTEETMRELVPSEPTRWENSASRVFVFQQGADRSFGAGANATAAAAIDASVRHQHSRSTVHNPPSPPRRSKHAAVTSTEGASGIEAPPRSSVVPLLSYRVVASLRRIFATIVESEHTAPVCDLLGAVTLVLSEVARFDKDFDLTEPLTLCFVNPQSMLVAAHAFRPLPEAGFDAFADATVLVMRARQRARRNLSSLPTVASLAPVLDMTMPEIAARLEGLLLDAADNSNNHKAAIVARVFVTDTIVALLEGQATVDDAWAAYATATCGTASTPLKATNGNASATSSTVTPQIMRFVDAERFVRQSPAFAVVEPRLLADALSAFASLDGQGALQFYEFQLVLCAIAIGPGGVAESDGELGDFSTGLKNALMAHEGVTGAAAADATPQPTATPVARSSRRTSLATGEL